MERETKVRFSYWGVIKTCKSMKICISKIWPQNNSFCTMLPEKEKKQVFDSRPYTWINFSQSTIQRNKQSDKKIFWIIFSLISNVMQIELMHFFRFSSYLNAFQSIFFLFRLCNIFLLIKFHSCSWKGISEWWS